MFSPFSEKSFDDHDFRSLFETGANDVLVVAPCEGSIDDREHLVPWIPNEVVKDIALTERRIEVDWYVDA